MKTCKEIGWRLNVKCKVPEQTFEKDIDVLRVTGKIENIQSLMKEIVKGAIEIINKK